MNAKPHISPRAWLEDEIHDLLLRHGLIVSVIDDEAEFVEIHASDPHRQVNFDICLRSDEDLDDPNFDEEDDE